MGIARRSGIQGRVSLDSYIVSATDYHGLRHTYGDGSWTREDFERRHILFQDMDGRYVEKLLAGDG